MRPASINHLSRFLYQFGRVVGRGPVKSWTWTTTASFGYRSIPASENPHARVPRVVRIQLLACSSAARPGRQMPFARWRFDRRSDRCLLLLQCIAPRPASRKPARRRHAGRLSTMPSVRLSGCRKRQTAPRTSIRFCGIGKRLGYRGIAKLSSRPCDLARPAKTGWCKSRSLFRGGMQAAVLTMPSK